MQRTMECQLCKATFTTLHPRKKFCSPDCKTRFFNKIGLQNYHKGKNANGNTTPPAVEPINIQTTNVAMLNKQVQALHNTIKHISEGNRKTVGSLEAENLELKKRNKQLRERLESRK